MWQMLNFVGEWAELLINRIQTMFIEWMGLWVSYTLEFILIPGFYSDYGAESFYIVFWIWILGSPFGVMSI